MPTAADAGDALKAGPLSPLLDEFQSEFVEILIDEGREGDELLDRLNRGVTTEE